MSSPEPIVAKGLGRQFGDNVVIEPLDVSVDRGQRVGIVGADGAGKTTLLQMLAGILDPTVGNAGSWASIPVVRPSRLLPGLAICPRDLRFTIDSASRKT